MRDRPLPSLNRTSVFSRIHADWTAFGACINGSIAHPRDATRPGSGSDATTSTGRQMSRSEHPVRRSDENLLEAEIPDQM
jgi:hypothetical protein